MIACAAVAAAAAATGGGNEVVRTKRNEVRRAEHPPLRQRPPAERERLAERVAERLDLPVTLGGAVLVLVFVADQLTRADSPLKPVWAVAGWTLWALFVLEFVLRLVIAPSAPSFLRRNWWQVVFLLVPFLRFLRAFSRSARLARVASTSVRGARTAGANLAGRIGWLLGVTVAVVLGASEVLYAYGPRMTYGQALHSALLGAVSGERTGQPGAVVAVVEVVLAVHAAVVFAALAGALGAYFVERRGAERDASGT